MLERDANFQRLSKLADANINRACWISGDTEIRYNTRHAINDNDTNKSKNCRPQAVVLLFSEPRAERQKVKLCKFLTKKKKKKRRDLEVERKFPLICPLANAENKANDASVFVGRVFFILIRNLELQRGVSEKGLDLQTHSANALFKRTLQRSTN